MAVATTVPPTVNQTNLEKIESFLNDPAYKELLENSATYNTRLCIERRLRLPFLDNQTGVAQNHSQLFMHKRQRMPGLMQGQIYTYPRQRWRKKRRQYLTMNSRAFARAADALLDGENDMHSISQVENPALQDTDSKDSQLLKDEVKFPVQEWFYDEQDMLEMDAYDEPDPDSDLDYEESYTKRSKRRKTSSRNRNSDSPSTPGRRKGTGRGRKKASMHSFDPTPGDPDKPFACELCGARYKTRPGLTYHYSHSHKEGASDENSRDSVAPPAGGATPAAAPAGQPVPAVGTNNEATPPPAQSSSASQGNVYQDSYVSFLNHPAGPTSRNPRSRPPPHLPNPPPQPPVHPQSQAPPTLPPNLPAQPQPTIEDPPMPILVPEKTLDAPTTSTVHHEPPRDGKAAPSPYCDFCLGDARENKKTGGSEELVSCSDCGRSGHPTCLQFTSNMIISVKKYRWQCIECKCCSVCGTSDNDDQLLFCDDCDRGYHMYCLTPPLHTPPEGSWSCKLCIDQFHK